MESSPCLEGHNSAPVYVNKMIYVYIRSDKETLLIRPSPPSESEWVFRIGRTRDIRFSCGHGLIAKTPPHLGSGRWQPVDVRYAERRLANWRDPGGKAALAAHAQG
jgi:hypothetical protein